MPDEPVTGNEPNVDDPKANPPEPKPKDRDNDKIFTQADLDRHMDERLARERKQSKERESEVAEKVRKDAEEAQLMEKQEHKALAERYKADLETERAKNEAHENEKRINAVLDSEDITDKAERRFIHASGVTDVVAIRDQIRARKDLIESEVQKQVDAEVAKRLGSDAPPKGPHVPDATRVVPEGKTIWDGSDALKGKEWENEKARQGVVSTVKKE